MAWWVHHEGYVSTANARFLRQAGEVAAGGRDLGGLGSAYPPVPTLLAGVLPGGALTLSLVACLFGAIALHRTWASLVRRRLSTPFVVCLLMPLFAVPAVTYVATQSLAAIGSLTLVAVALEGLAWFTLARNTEAGFVTGLALAGAFLLDPLAIFVAVAVALMALLIARERFRTEPGAALATVLVMTFPVTFLMLSWTYLEWRFTGDALGWFRAAAETVPVPDGLWGGLLVALASVGATVAVAPLYPLVAALYWREPLTMLGQLVPVPVLVVALWLDLPLTAVSAYVLLTLVALTHVPRGLSRPQQGLLAVVALVQVVLVWTWPPQSAGFDLWLRAVVPGS